MIQEADEWHCGSTLHHGTGMLLIHPTFLSSVPSQSQNPSQHSPPSCYSPCSAFHTRITMTATSVMWFSALTITEKIEAWRGEVAWWKPHAGVWQRQDDRHLESEFYNDWWHCPLNGPIQSSPGRGQLQLAGRPCQSLTNITSFLMVSIGIWVGAVSCVNNDLTCKSRNVRCVCFPHPLSIRGYNPCSGRSTGWIITTPGFWFQPCPHLTLWLWTLLLTCFQSFHL